MASLLSGCSSGGGGSSSLVVLDAVVEQLGELPIEAIFLNNELTVTFSTKLDPASVSTQTVRVLKGPSFTELAPGVIEVDGAVVRFRPRTPLMPDLSDGGFEPDTEYRLLLRGRPDLNTLRSHAGKPLAATRTFTFTTRFEAPFFFDPVPGPPNVAGVFLDLDGNGVLDADGDPATVEPEEFFASDSVFDRFDPFTTGVRTGSAGLTSPDTPLLIGFLFDEVIDPASVFPDLDFDDMPDAFSVLDITNEYACDDPTPGDTCPRPILHGLELEEFAPAPGTGFARSLVRTRVAYGLLPQSVHRIVAAGSLRDLNGNRIGVTFNAAFETGDDRPSEDFFFEDFSTTMRRGSGTTALWNPQLGTRLTGGIGFGGDGSDGVFLGDFIDTRANDGVFNFSSWDSTFNVTLRGPNPAIIRIYGDYVSRPLGLVFDASGEFGFDGQAGTIEAIPGGRGGPGGFAGGRGGLLEGTDVAEDGGAPAGTEGEGHGGESGADPGGGGGAGHRTIGQPGTRGDDASGGAGGDRYGAADASELLVGSGGGAGGSDIVDDENGISGGGSGGGGGGVFVFETFGRVEVGAFLPQNQFHLMGGRGGLGAETGTGPSSAAGGGGSGGTMLYRGRDVLAGITLANGGRGGTGVSRGGDGSEGRIRIESLDGAGRCFGCEPDAVIERIPESVLGKSAGRSDFLFTHPPVGRTIVYAFDGNEPGGGLAGKLRYDAEDIVVLDARGERARSDDDLPPGSSLSIFFRGAFEDPARPNYAAEGTVTPWFADITVLNGFPLIQWEVRFSSTAMFTLDPAEDPPMPSVDDVRIRFRFE